MPCTIEALLVGKVGFASHQNAAPVLADLVVRNAGNDSAEHCILRMESDPPFLTPREWKLDRIDAEGELQIRDRNVKLSAGLLSGLTEAINATIFLTLYDAEGRELARLESPVELLAHNQWGGVGSMAELLPAFAMPNDPAVDTVLKAASDALRRSGLDDQINGYQSGQRTRVWELVSAIWTAIAGMRLSYALPPASFETHGQKIRTPSQILDGRVATCLDTSLLFAAALEQARLNPIVIFTKGHAFVGVWLQPSEFSSLLTHEAAALRRRIDINELIVFESTLITQEVPPSFSQAIEEGVRNIAGDKDDEFEMAVDIRRARMLKMLPLGVALERKSTDTQPILVSEAVEGAPLLPSFDKETEEEVLTPGGRVKQWQRKLLNLTTANRLLNLSETSKAVQLVCPEPAKLEDLLSAGGKVKILPFPDLEASGRDEDLYNQQQTASLRDEVAREALERKEVLAKLPKEQLQANLIELYRKANSDMEEGGANTLYLAVGFLKWKKSEKETKTYRAPLILLPVKLERKSALSGVTMVQHEDEPRFNLTLLELLRQDFELKIPEVEGDLPRDASGIDVPLIWRYTRTLLSRLNNKAKDAIILVQQRLHLDDLAGHVEELDDWVTLRLPAIAEEDASIPIGPGRVYHRKADDVLHPEREPREVLEQLRRSLGRATFSAQYQQCPVPADGEIVRWGWFRRCPEPPPRQQLTIVQSWDTASKPDEHCDYSVCTTWGIRGDDLFLLDVFRARLDFPSLKRKAIELARHWQPCSLLIEDKGSGTALIQQLRAEPNGIPYPTAFVPKDDKFTRLHTQSAWIEAGHVWLPEQALWLEDLRIELASFPQGRNDDQVDSVSQFLAWHFGRRGRQMRMVRLLGV